jgi:hypothetical protein
LPGRVPPWRARHTQPFGDLRAGQAVELGQQKGLKKPWLEQVEHAIDALKAVEDQPPGFLRGHFLLR